MCYNLNRTGGNFKLIKSEVKIILKETYLCHVAYQDKEIQVIIRRITRILAHQKKTRDIHQDIFHTNSNQEHICLLAPMH